MPMRAHIVWTATINGQVNGAIHSSPIPNCAPALVGRGGWTWYTGSASWMYRVAVESLLGFDRRGDHLAIVPRVPAGWASYTIEYRHGTSMYAIEVKEPAEVARLGARYSLDGASSEAESIPLVDDGARHVVVVSARRA